MGNQFVKATESAIERLVTDFQNYPDRFWNERDLHWGLFYYLRQEAVVSEADATQLIRAEFPTIKKFNHERGHYDLVVLNPQSYKNPAIQSMKAQDSWDGFLKLVEVIVAVEIKLWLARLPCERADWDIRKLMEPPNNVLNAFFLNFVQLDFSRQHAKNYYRELREYLMCHKKRYPELKILCVPSEIKIQPDSSQNWLSLP